MPPRRRDRFVEKASRFLSKATATTRTSSGRLQGSGQTLQPLSTVPPRNNTPEPQAPALSTNLGLLTERQEPNTTSSTPLESPRGQTPPVPTAENTSTVSTITHTVSPTPDPSTPQSQVLSSYPGINLAVQPPLTNRNGTTSLWIKAFEELSEDDKAALPLAGNDTTEELLKDIKNRADLCAQGDWKVKFRGNEIVVRDVVEKLLTWVDKFKSVGDIAIQYDPVHAALPWAGIRFLLQISLSEMESMGVIMTGTERVARLVVRGAIYEKLYLGPESTVSTPIRTGLAKDLLDLYVTVLKFLACAKRYLVQPTAARVLRSVVDPGQLRSSFDAIEEGEVLLEMDLKTAERESQNDHRIMLKQKTREMEMFFGEIDKAVMLLHDEFRAYTHAEKQHEVLKWLSTVEFIKHHQTAREGLLENTGLWLLKLEQFRQWRASRSSGILWLHGIPGAGKTKLTCMVIEFLKSLPQSDGPVVYFYCKRDDPQRRDPEVIMQAILKHFCLAFKNLPSQVVHEYDKRKEKGHAAGSLGFTECKNLIASLLNIYSHTTIVIDALDESDPDERWRLLESFENILDSSTSPVKIFVSSRDDIDIKLRLEKVPNHYIDTKDNTGDIERFVIREVTSAIGQKRLLYGTVSDSLKQKIISTVAERSDGMFQWADLQIKNLYRLKSPEEIEQNLGKLPKTLEATYSRMWQEILEETTEAQRRITEKALMWLICSRIRLNPQRWVEFAYWPEAVPQNGVDVLFDLCRNLTRWDRQVDRVVFAHLSVQEFFESHIFTPVQANSMAAQSCLLLLTSPDAQRGWATSAASGDQSLFPSYSAERWAEHVDLCYNAEQHMGNDVRDLLLRFLGTRTEPSQPYSHWLRSAIEKDHYNFYYESQQEGIKHLESKPLDPLFAMSYFRFGEELLPEFEARLGGIDINSRNLLGETLLYVATKRGNERVMDLLLEKQADVNAMRRRRARYSHLPFLNTPLVVAIRKGHSGAVLKLLAKGATIASDSGVRADTLEAAACIGPRDVIEKMMYADTGLEVTEAVLVSAAGNTESGREVMEILLGRCPDTAITEAVLVKAAEDSKVMGILLPRCPDTAVTEAVLVKAAERGGREMMEILLPRCPDTAITEAVLVKAAENSKVMEILLPRCPDTAITEAVLVKAAEDSKVMGILLPRCPDTAVTEAVLVKAAENSKVMEILLPRCPDTAVTEAVLVSAAGNTLSRWKVMQILLPRCPDTAITETVLVSAAGDWRGGQEEMEILLPRCPDTAITEAVLVAAAGRTWSGREVMEILLPRCPDTAITEAVLVKAAKNSKVMEILLPRCPDTAITEAVLVSAAGNTKSGREVMEILLARCPDTAITEAVLVKAAKRGGREMMEILLPRCPDTAITEAVLVKAAGSQGSGREVMEILLPRCPDNVITEAVLVKAVGRGGREVMQILLPRCPDTAITETVLVKAAENSEVMEILLPRCPDTAITEAVLVAAAGRTWSGREVMEILLPRCPDNVITEAVLVNAAGNSKVMEILLPRCPDTAITEAVLVEAVWRGGREVMQILLPRCPDTAITEAVLVKAAGSRGSGREVMDPATKMSRHRDHRSGSSQRRGEQ